MYIPCNIALVLQVPMSVHVHVGIYIYTSVLLDVYVLS